MLDGPLLGPFSTPTPSVLSARKGDTRSLLRHGRTSCVAGRGARSASSPLGGIKSATEMARASRSRRRRPSPRRLTATGGSPRRRPRWTAADGFDPHAGKETFEAYAARWIETRLVKGRPLAPRTAELYRAQLKNHIAPALGATQLRQLEAAAVRTWYGRLTGPQGPGQITAAKCYRLLRAICTTAVEDNLIPRNPCSIRGAGQERPSERPMFTLAQVQALAGTVDDRWRALILMAAWTGLRIGELAALRREDLDLEGGTVTVKTAVVDVIGEARTYGPPKSAAGKRKVAIPPHIIGALEQHMKDLRPTRRSRAGLRRRQGRPHPAQQLLVQSLEAGGRGRRSARGLASARPARVGRDHGGETRSDDQRADASPGPRLTVNGPQVPAR